MIMKSDRFVQEHENEAKLREKEEPGWVACVLPPVKHTHRDCRELRQKLIDLKMTVAATLSKTAPVKGIPAVSRINHLLWLLCDQCNLLCVDFREAEEQYGNMQKHVYSDL